MGPSLLLETSTRRPSALICCEHGSLAFDYLEASTLTAFLADAPRRLLEYWGLTVDSLELLGLGVGPGSYTGLRCGAAYVQALYDAVPGEKPLLLGIPSLLAWGLECAAGLGVEGRILMTANAYQGDLYLRALTVRKSTAVDTGRDEVIPVEGFTQRVLDESEKCRNPVTVLGFGCGILLNAHLPEGTVLVPEAGVPSARGLRMALAGMGAEPFHPKTGLVEPVYLRPSAAEMKKKRNTGRA